MMYNIIDEVSSERIEKDITKLVSFGTRHTLSDTISDKRGIGAARRWIKKEFEIISSECNKCLEVFYEKSYVTEGDRIVFPTWIYNVVAIQSAANDGTELTLVGNTNWSWIQGDYINVYGCRDDVTGESLGVDGAYKVAYVSTTTIRLLQPQCRHTPLLIALSLSHQ